MSRYRYCFSINDLDIYPSFIIPIFSCGDRYYRQISKNHITISKFEAVDLYYIEHFFNVCEYASKSILCEVGDDLIYTYAMTSDKYEVGTLLQMVCTFLSKRLNLDFQTWMTDVKKMLSDIDLVNVNRNSAKLIAGDFEYSNEEIASINKELTKVNIAICNIARNIEPPRLIKINETYSDIVLICRDCGQSFVFTVNEQEFYNEKGFQVTPTRCLDCRMARRANRIKAPRKQYEIICRGIEINITADFPPKDNQYDRIIKKDKEIRETGQIKQ